MQTLSFALNIPWTLLGILIAIFSLPTKVNLYKKPLAIIVSVKGFWWYSWLPSKKGRAMTQGHVVLTTSRADDKDLAHELIHVRQFEREPFIHPFLYAYQSFKHGYRQNKYEVEAYQKSNSRYIEN